MFRPLAQTMLFSNCVGWDNAKISSKELILGLKSIVSRRVDSESSFIWSNMFRVIPELRLKGVDTQDLKDHSFLSTEINTGHSNGRVLFFLTFILFLFFCWCLFIFIFCHNQTKQRFVTSDCLFAIVNYLTINSDSTKLFYRFHGYSIYSFVLLSNKSYILNV